MVVWFWLCLFWFKFGYWIRGGGVWLVIYKKKLKYYGNFLKLCCKFVKFGIYSFGVDWDKWGDGFLGDKIAIVFV